MSTGPRYVKTPKGVEELRGHFEAWREAIRLSREGRNEFADLEGRLTALLS